MSNARTCPRFWDGLPGVTNYPQQSPSEFPVLFPTRHTRPFYSPEHMVFHATRLSLRTFALRLPTVVVQFSCSSQLCCAALDPFSVAVRKRIFYNFSEINRIFVYLLECLHVLYCP